MEDGMTPDLQVEYDNLMRRRKIADAMIQRAQTQQPITHWTQGLAQLYNAYQGKKIADEVSGKEKELKARAAQGEQAAIDELKRSISGREAQILAPDEVGPAAPAMPAPREKVRQALIEAQMSQYPKLRQFGAVQQKFVEADEERADATKARKDQISVAAEDRLAQIRLAESERRITKKESDEREAALRRELAKLKGGAGGEGGEYGTFLPVTGPDGRVTYQFGVQKGPRSGQIVTPAAGGAPAQYSPVVQQGLAASKEMGKAAGKDFASIGDYKDTSDSLKTAEDLTRKGIYTGTLAEWKLAGAKAAGLVGGDTEKASNTEQFKLHIAETVIPMLKLLGGNDTDEERKYLEKMMAGDIRLEPATISAKLKSAQEKLDRKARRAEAGVGTPAPATPKQAGGLTPQEQAEIDALRKRFGK